MMSTSKRRLIIQGLKVCYDTEEGVVKAVDDIDLWVDAGEIVGLVGESGCGKSTVALSILKLLPPEGRIIGGKILFKGMNLLEKGEDELAKTRGSEISIIFQHPFTSLNPLYRVGDLVAETLMSHQNISKDEALTKTLEILDYVGLPDPEDMMYKYPHEMSGGMAQRVMIGIAVSCHPSVLIADEPTSDLDVTIQAQILRLLKTLNENEGVSILLITHNLGIVAELCDRVTVMYAGKIVECGGVTTVFEGPKHPYTIGLINAIPRIDEASFILNTIPGVVPSLINPPKGCVFNPRCNCALEKCNKEKPPAVEVEPRHLVYCHLLEGK